jgi:GT2 family glycosyltransferase
VATDRTHILVLNHDGAALLGECLPSIVIAADRSPVPCCVSVVDNASTDHSVAYVESHWPSVGIIRCSNEGLVSFNHVLARLDEPAVLLLNNDVKLAPDAIAPLLRALKSHGDALFAAPQCWTFDAQTYEGMRTRVRLRFGLIQGMSRVPGHQNAASRPDLTAAAGPVLMVDRRKFLEIGGYDRLYRPGRVEDLDLGYSAWLSGYRGYYEPASVAYHKGFASFAPAFGISGCDLLATRNSVLFAWKNLRGPRLWRHIAWLGPRVAWSMLTRRGQFAQALCGALRRLPEAIRARRSRRLARSVWWDRQETYFQRFGW